MFVTVPGRGQVQVVVELSSGQCDVGELAGFSAGAHGVAAVGGDALGAVDRSGVPELHVLPDVSGRQGDLASGGEVGDVQASVAANVGDGPAVTVADEVGGAGA